MRIITYKNIQTYMDDALALLSPYALQNNLIIGNCIRAKENKIDTKNYFLATVCDHEDQIKLIVMQTPPYPLLIFEVDNKANSEALSYLIDYIISNEIEIPGVVTEKNLAKRFSELYAKKTNSKIRRGKNLRIYQLDEVKYRGEVDGYLRKATMDDLYFLPYWKNEFKTECQIDIKENFSSLLEKTKKQIEEGVLYIYEDKIPVSMIISGRKTLNGIIISSVYTPPYYRKKGYATAMVFDLCTQLLKKDYQYCGLFTDLDNPISNSIYQKVGFYPVCDYDEVFFHKG